MPTKKKADVQEKEEKEVVEVQKEEESSNDIQVSEPHIVKPKDLPLVVKPPQGKEWANAEQAEYARTVNAYAYKNPDKWATKKDTLLASLRRLETDPGYINVLRGAEDENTRLQYSNKLHES